MCSITVAYGVNDNVDFKGRLDDMIDLVNIHRK
jgi:hypothetical protein